MKQFCNGSPSTGTGGLLWDRFGASFTFYAGATFALPALFGLLRQTWRQRRQALFH